MIDYYIEKVNIKNQISNHLFMKVPSITIGIIGDYNFNNQTHVYTNAAIAHCENVGAMNLDYYWLSSSEVMDEISFLGSKIDGIVVVPGPYKNPLGLFELIGYVKSKDIPCLITGDAFDYLALEFFGTKINPEVHSSSYQKMAKENETEPSEIVQKEISIQQGSKLASAYSTSTIASEYFYGESRYGLAIDEIITESGIKITAKTTDGMAAVIEYPSLTFLMGTRFVPQMKSVYDQPHALFVELFRRVMLNSQR